MSLAPYVRAMGRGPARARSLTREEAADAMSQMLAGTAEREAVGALLMLMRYRGETPEEIAGFVDALGRGLEPWRALPTAIDWPSYAAGRSRGLPWFLLAARLIASPSKPVFLHGWNSHQGDLADVRRAALDLQIPIVATPDEAGLALTSTGIAYAPLEAIDERALEILRLRDKLGLRSAINTALRLMNPTGAKTSVQGVFHPPYRALQQSAGVALAQERQLIIKGGGGEFERHPGKHVDLYGVLNGVGFEGRAEPLIDHTGRLAELTGDRAHLADLWCGRWDHPVAEAVVTGTAGLALFTDGQAPTLNQAEQLAAELWHRRHHAHAA